VIDKIKEILSVDPEYMTLDKTNIEFKHA
jgi:hypothetical protein